MTYPKGPDRFLSGVPKKKRKKEEPGTPTWFSSCDFYLFPRFVTLSSVCLPLCPKGSLCVRLGVIFFAQGLVIWFGCAAFVRGSI